MTRSKVWNESGISAQMRRKAAEALQAPGSRVSAISHALKGFIGPLIVTILVAAGCSRSSEEARIHASLPAEIDENEQYLFYLHGRIIEDKGVRAVHPRFGVYEYQRICEAFADSGFSVVSEPRPPNTEIEEYADKVATQIRTLLKGGVDGRSISVVGHSKGAVIALRLSTLLKDDKIAYVILAGCSQNVADKLNLKLTGRILSLFDATDDLVGSCAGVFEKSGPGLAHHEIELHVEHRPGFGHGIFYRPADAWISPVVRWIKQEG
jgi:hypothetical protein